MKSIFFIFLLFFVFSFAKASQKQVFSPDSNIVFTSPHPLIEYSHEDEAYLSVIGGDIYFSKAGYGFGFFWENSLNHYFSFNSKIYAAVAKNTDELERYDYISGFYFIPDKINSVYITPLIFSLKYNLFADHISNSFSPFISFGVGPALIYTMPYRENQDPNGRLVGVFSALGDTQFYARFATMLGAGFSFGMGGSHTSLNIEYYFIPSGNLELESIYNNPIKDFGGLNLSISIGMKY